MTAIDLRSPRVVPLDQLVTALAGDDRLVHLERLPPRGARFAPLGLDLPGVVAERLPVGGFWTHQAEAIDLARAGRSVAVATGTASGKSLCFQVPIAEATTDRVRPGTALLLFPTKALAHDQLRSMAAWAVPGMVPAAYDGDCDPDERAWVRHNANVLFTNPEMLHGAMLPHHRRWANFLMRLRYVVVDELHTFRGIFGSHVAHVLRRLRRVCAHYGASPTFVFASATIGEPEALASHLCGLPVTAVADDGSPRGERLVALWNPPLMEHRDGRASAHGETAHLLANLVEAGYRGISFCRSRRATEVVAADVRRRLPPDLAPTVRPYRGGYLPAERREIEGELFGGRLNGVVATTALELGVDVGGLDTCILDGFPGTVASMWQQMGRAGRAGQQSLAVLVAGEDQLDQWLMQHPEELFSRRPEPAVINPANPQVFHEHLACAAFELPLTPDDERWWPDLLDDGVRALVVGDHLKVRPPTGRRGRPTAVWSGRGYPAGGIGLRSAGAGEVRIVMSDETPVGTVEVGRAPELVHPGAIYLHQGIAYQVLELDLADRLAVVEPTEGDTYTMARSTTDITIKAVDAQRPVGRASLYLGSVDITSQVTGFQRRSTATHEVLCSGTLDLPPSVLHTRAFWYVITEVDLISAGLTPDRWPGTLHAAEHAGIGLLPLFTICDRWDVGGVSTALQAQTMAPTIVIYDGYPGGVGIAELGFEAADRHLGATLELIARCPCSDGCPSCVQSPKCGNWNEPLDKSGAVYLLRHLLDL